MPKKGSRPPGRRVRILLQMLVAALAWIIFGFLWYITLADRVTGRRPFYELAIIALTAVAIVLVTRWWIWHNLQIYRRKGPRRNVATASFDFSRDWLGHEVRGDWNHLGEARLIIIDIEEDTKSYRSALLPRR